jgi:hypothetical protein
MSCGVLLLLLLLLSPASARAQAADTWEINVAPLYFWAS